MKQKNAELLHKQLIKMSDRQSHEFDTKFIRSEIESLKQIIDIVEADESGITDFDVKLKQALTYNDNDNKNDFSIFRFA